jgi:hypothetical protein
MCDELHEINQFTNEYIWCIYCDEFIGKLEE